MLVPHAVLISPLDPHNVVEHVPTHELEVLLQRPDLVAHGSACIRQFSVQIDHIQFVLKVKDKYVDLLLHHEVPYSLTHVDLEQVHLLFDNNGVLE